MKITLKRDANSSGFTIVELLVVIVVIGILASITIVSYLGISQKATVAGLQSDLSGAANKLKMYYTEYGVFPDSLNGSNCPSGIVNPADAKYCIKPTPGNTYTYYSSSPYSDFSLVGKNTASNILYRTTNNSAPLIFDSNWIAGVTSTVMEGKYVYNRDINSSDKYTTGLATGNNIIPWKTIASTCSSPQCAIGLDSFEPTYMSLVADNSVDFALAASPPIYPARDACKVLGGRLPTVTELLNIYTNRASYGTFQLNFYWASTDNSTTNSYVVDFNTGNWAGTNKTNYLYARCVLN